jgi:nicotinamidase-related amidase
MQKAFHSLDVCRDSFGLSIPVINETIKKFRASGHPVIFTRTAEAHKIECQHGLELIEALSVQSHDKIIDKSFPNAFWETDLEVYLKCQKVSSVVICGCFSMACVYLTHYGAIERGFTSFTLAEGTISSDDSAIDLLQKMTDHLAIGDL